VSRETGRKEHKMRRAYRENGIIKHANVKDVDLDILSTKALDSMSDSSRCVYVDADGNYYVSDNQNSEMYQVGTLDDLNEFLCAGLEEE
jgi:hypothetical protein